MRATMLTVCAMAAAYGMDGLREGGGDSWKTTDKAEHAAAGFVIAGLTDVVISEVRPETPRWQRIAWSVAATAVVGIAKEAYDSRHPDTHDCSLKDGLATVAGGLAGAVVLDITVHF